MSQEAFLGAFLFKRIFVTPSLKEHAIFCSESIDEYLDAVVSQL